MATCCSVNTSACGNYKTLQDRPVCADGARTDTDQPSKHKGSN